MDFNNFNLNNYSINNMGMGGNTPAQPGGVLNLEKNQVLDLTKAAPALTKCILGAGWDVSEIGPSFDLDIAAFLLDRNGKVPAHLINSRVVFFNNLAVPGVRLEGDNRTGEGEGDDERIDIDLTAIDPEVDRIVFFVTIFEAVQKRQTFGMVNNSFVRLLDANDNEREILRYPLKGRYDTDTAITFCELKRNGMGWEFKAIGDGSVGDLNALIARYM